MSRQRKDPLRPLTADERQELYQVPEGVTRLGLTGLRQV